MKYIFIVIVGFLITGCFANKARTDSISLVNLDNAKAKFPGYNAEQYNAGKVLYETKCNTCHGLKDPLKFNEERLTKTVPNMDKKANTKKDAKLSAEDGDFILKYLITQIL